MIDAENSLLTEELKSWIGRSGPEEALVLITSSDIRRYIDATGDANPLWLDDQFARSLGYRSRLLPPTLVGWVPFSIKESGTNDRAASIDLRRQLPIPAHYTNVRNAGSETEWLKPVYLGEQLSSQSIIVEIVTRQGKFGTGIYVTQTEEIRNPSREVVMRRQHTMALFPHQSLGDKGER
jgi:acyl dehydratase